MFRTLIYPSSGAWDCVDELPHRSSFSQFVVCWSSCCGWYLVVFVLQAEATANCLFPCSRVIVKRIIVQCTLTTDRCIHQTPPPISVPTLNSADQVLPFSFLKDTCIVFSHVVLGLADSLLLISSRMYFCSLLHRSRLSHLPLSGHQKAILRGQQIFASTLTWEESEEKCRCWAIPVFYFAGPVFRCVRRITKSDF